MDIFWYMLGYKETESNLVQTHHNNNQNQNDNEIKSISLVLEQPKKQINLLNIEHPTNFYYLSLIKEEDTWSIHGLWPQYSENEYPSFCKKVDFDIDKLKPILTELKQFWYSTKDTNEDFWKHEWQKHGSCVFTEIDELTYFKTTLSLYVDCIQNDCIDKYKKNDTQSLVPISLDFKIISN